MATYTAAKPVAEMAAKVALEHHPHLADARIAFLFVDPPPKSKGRELSGRASRVTAKVNGILDAAGVTGTEEGVYDFLVEIAEAHWLVADPATREALVDHELSHLWWRWDKTRVVTVDPETGEETSEIRKVFKGWTLRTHDVEEFREVLERRGLWTDDLVRFATTLDAVRTGFAGHRARKGAAKAFKPRLVAGA